MWGWSERDPCPPISWARVSLTRSSGGLEKGKKRAGHAGPGPNSSGLSSSASLPQSWGALNSRPMQAAGSVGRPAFSWALSPFQETGRRQPSPFQEAGHQSPLAAGFGQARAGYASAASSCRLLHPD